MTMITLPVQSTFYLLSASQTSFLSVLKDAPYYLNGEVVEKRNAEKPRRSKGFRHFLKPVKIANQSIRAIFLKFCASFKSTTLPLSRGAYYLLTACQFLFKSKKDELLHPSSYADYLPCNDSIAIRMPSLNA